MVLISHTGFPESYRVNGHVLTHTHRQHVHACLGTPQELIFILCVISHPCPFFSNLKTGSNISLTCRNSSFFRHPELPPLFPFLCLLTSSLDFHTKPSLLTHSFGLFSLLIFICPSLLFLFVSLSQGGMYGERQASLPLMDSYDG